MSAPSDLVLMARVAGSLVVVVLVALLAARLARRVGVRSAGPGLRVVERVGLTREAGAVVLEVDGRHLLLGVTAHGVSLLADLGGANPVLVAEPHALVAETD
ncbi:MAG TPA: flagellar biosynthetic protein FliO, partial [Kineosporiaceae bacterium]|nr:flagellar biosynthetic protein FliO [Kineosporiaceae bacterium]